MLERTTEVLDGMTVAFFGGSALHYGMHFALLDVDVSLSKGIASHLVAWLTVAIGIGKLYELLTGKKVADLFRKRKD